MSAYLQSLAKELFWDVDLDTVEEDKHRRFIIERVLERGELPDIRSTIAHYTLPVVISEAQ